MNYNAIYDQYRQYSKTFDKYGIRIAETAAFTENGGHIIMTTERYEKSPTARYFSNKPKRIEVEEITGKQLLNVYSSIGYFSNKVTGQGYTFIGYIPLRITTTGPDRNTKIVVKIRLEQRS